MSAPTPQQQAAITARGNVLVAAGAGTGKTSTVTQRCLDLVLREGCSVDQILMVTFTEAAAAEMRGRLHQQLRAAADAAAPESDSALWLAGQLALLETASISTLHSFCLELVLRNFYALQLDPQLAVLDEAHTKPLIHAVLDELLLHHYASETTDSAAVRELIRAYGRGHDAPIRDLVVQLHRHAQALAAPNTWFTEQTAIFTNEKHSAWRKMLVQAVLAWRQEWRETIEPFALSSKTVRACANTLDNISAQSHLAETATQLSAILAADNSKWDALKKDFRDPIKGFFDGARFLHDLAQNDGAALAEDWKWSREPMLTLLRLAQEFGAAFTAAKRELGGIDFADQEQLALQLLLKPDGSPTAVAQACREKFRFVFVDECQDINAAQDAIIRAISGDGAAGNRFLVGDVKQSIYRFRLADPRIFQNYQAHWQIGTNPSPGFTATLSPSDGERDGVRGNLQSASSGQTLPLTENFRSAEGLLRFINPVFRTLMRPVVGGLNYSAAAELQFGAPEMREALAAKRDSHPRVTLHVITKEDDPGLTGDDPTEADTNPTEIPDLQSAEREARLIARQLRRLNESRHLVWNRESEAGGFRPVDYSDMVVLLRGIAGRAEIFAKTFHQAGVPLLATRAGFLNALEVTDLLNLLRLLDNPLQDLPVLAVLRSPFVSLSANELAQIRVAERHGLIWTALTKLARTRNQLPVELNERLSDFLEQFHRWRDLTRHSSLTHCIETALNETHYESLLLANERGSERVANVRRLVEMARRFDPYQREGLYRFLQFISEQEAAEVDHQPAEATSANAVRLMTIHASKGLEFPVVVLAGLGTRFNLRELSGDILLNEKFGLCPKIFPPGTRSKYPSIAHWAATQRERRALLGEELRLLYVAMTRARDTLLLVGTATKRDEAERWQTATPITNHALLKAGNYLDWLRLWFTNEVSSASWTSAAEGNHTLLSWKFWSPNDARFFSVSSPSGADVGEIVDPAPEQLAHIQAVLAARYQHEIAVTQPAKTTVTAIRRRVADDSDDESRRLFPESPAILLSQRRDSRLSAAEIGTAHHSFLQFVDIKRSATELDLRNEAARLERNGALSPEQVGALDFAALAAFWQSRLGAAIRALPENVVNREMPFTARFQLAELEALLRPGVAANEFIERTESDFVVVQGIADLVVLRPNEIWLLDFKTDHVSAADLPAKVKHYEPQLKIYAIALDRIYHRPVTHCCLHFLSAQETVSIER